MKAYFLEDYENTNALAALLPKGKKLAVFPNGWVQEKRGTNPTMSSHAWSLIHALFADNEDWGDGFWISDAEINGNTLTLHLLDGHIYRYGKFAKSWKATKRIDPTPSRQYTIRESQPENIEDWIENILEPS